MTLKKLFLREIRSQRTSSKCDFVLVFGSDNINSVNISMRPSRTEAKRP